jgi:tetratricopeptide (TPR) repeat protein
VLNINERLGRRDNEASTYLSLGLLSRERGDLVAAQRWFSKAVELYRALKDPSNEAFALCRLASLKANEERFEDAIEMAQTALPLVIGRNAAFTEDLWELIGRANLKLGFVIRAEEAYREALGLARELKATKAEAGISQNLGLALLLQQRDGEAATAFAQAAELHQTLGDSDNCDYCKLCEAAVRLDERLAKLSEEGHAFPDLERQREAAHEMVAVYPDLIAMYEKIGATQLVGAFCESAASRQGDRQSRVGASHSQDNLWRMLTCVPRIHPGDHEDPHRMGPSFDQRRNQTANQNSRVRDLRLSGRRDANRSLPGGEFPNHHVENRCQKETEKGDTKHARENRRAKGLSHFRTGALSQHKGKNAEDECEACHQDGTKPKPAGLNRRLEPITALLLALLGEFDDKDGVLAGEPHEHNETDLGEDVVIHAAQPDSGERRQHAHRHDENDAQG